MKEGDKVVSKPNSFWVDRYCDKPAIILKKERNMVKVEFYDGYQVRVPTHFFHLHKSSIAKLFL